MLDQHPEWIELIYNAINGKKVEGIIDDEEIVAEANKLVIS